MSRKRNGSENEEELIDSFHVLQKQEKYHYSCHDYLQDSSSSSSNSRSLTESSSSCQVSDASSSVVTRASTETMKEWRLRICNWKYHVADYFEFDREIVTISVSYMDRFLSTHVVDKTTLQLVAMASLHLATKLYGETVQLSSLLRLCRGKYKIRHIASMEQFVLSDLSWRVHPPSPQCFLRLLFQLPPLKSEKLDTSLKEELMDRSSLLVQLAVLDFFFVSKKPSCIALAAILYVLQDLIENRDDENDNERNDSLSVFSESVLACCYEDVTELSHSLTDGTEVEACYARLQALAVEEDDRNAEEAKEESQKEDDRVNNGRSPTCVGSLSTNSRKS